MPKFHANTEGLISAWRSRRAGRPLPARADLSPIDLGPLLPQVFILGRENDEEVFRLSGGLVADLWGRDLRGGLFETLWSKLDRPFALEALDRARKAAAPVVLTADAEAASGDYIGLELCLAPITGPSGVADRTLGLIQPISMVGRLMGQNIRTLSLRGATVAVEPPSPPALRLVALNGLRVA